LKIGVSTAIFWNYRELDLPNAIDHAVGDLDFEAVEIHCEDPVFEGWATDEADETRKGVKDALSRWDVEVSLHAPYHDANIATLNHGISREIMAQNKECIETANYLDSDIVVVHPGFVSSRKYKKELAFDKMVDRFKELCDYADDYGVTLTAENLASKRKAMGIEVSEIRELLGRVDRDNFGLTLDIAHSNTSEVGPQRFARELRPSIKHLHVSDNVGSDDHLSIGQGDIDFVGVFEELNPFEGTAIIEGWIPEDEDPFLKIGRDELKSIRNALD